MDWSSMVVVGHIVRPQHNRGEVVVRPESDFPDVRFAVGATVFRAAGTASSPLRVREVRSQDRRLVVGFEGIDTIDAAEALRGAELRVPSDWLQPLGPGQFYVHDLVGCQVRTGGGSLGPVAKVDLATGVPLLVIDRNGEEVLVPFVEVFVRAVDVPGRTIEIDPPPGLVELNRPDRP